MGARLLPGLWLAVFSLCLQALFPPYLPVSHSSLPPRSFPTINNLRTNKPKPAHKECSGYDRFQMHNTTAETTVDDSDLLQGTEA